MKLNNKIYYNIYICAFIFLVLCPAVHQLDDTVNHDMIIKSEARLQQREYHKSFDSNLIKIFNSYQTEPFNHTIPATRHTIMQSPVTPLGLFISSTERLNL